MRRSRSSALYLAAMALALAGVSPRAENVDPANDGSQYAWGENVGWINAEPAGDGGPGMSVSDTGLTGWLWGENVGWISLSCANTASCTTTDYAVTQDGEGSLGGWAWAENLGWISFSCENTASCATVAFGVYIDPLSGVFGGRAWSENAGWISFGSAGPNPFALRTGWTCTPPSGTIVLSVGKAGADADLSWNPISSISDVTGGDLLALRSTAGDFSQAVIGCISDNLAGGSRIVKGEPGAGDGLWFLVRGADCSGGSYDSGGQGQNTSRDTSIAASPNACP